MLQSVREVLLSIHNKFKLSRFLMCPAIDLNMCNKLLVKSVTYIHIYTHPTIQHVGSMVASKLTSIQHFFKRCPTHFPIVFLQQHASVVVVSSDSGVNRLLLFPFDFFFFFLNFDFRFLFV